MNFEREAFRLQMIRTCYHQRYLFYMRSLSMTALADLSLRVMPTISYVNNDTCDRALLSSDQRKC